MLFLVLSITIFSATTFGQTEPKGDYVTVNGKRLWYSASIGNELHLADVILERVQEAARTGHKAL